MTTNDDMGNLDSLGCYTVPSISGVSVPYDYELTTISSVPWAWHVQVIFI